MNDPKITPPSDAQYRLLVASVRDVAIFMLTADGHIASWNAGARKLKGYEADEIIGRHFSIFYPEEQVQRGWPDEELRRAAADGRFEDEGWRVRKDGTQFWANVIITALRDDRDQLVGFAKVTRDYTERRKQEESLRASEVRLRLLIESAVDYAIFMLDTNGYVRTWNTGAQRIKGYTEKDIVGQHFSRFYPPESNARRWPEYELQMAREHGRFEDEGWRVRKDGTQFWANVIITSVYDEQRTLIGFAKVTRDLTERDRVRALQRSEEHTDQFLAMLGHELRNPLGSMSNAAQVLRLATHNTTAAKACEILNRQLEHLSHMVDDLLDVSRIRSGAIGLRNEQLDLQDVLERAVESVRPYIDNKRQDLRLPQLNGTVTLRGDLGRLVQLLTNVLSNANKYTPDGGIITITVEAQHGTALISISDTGKGIPAELLPRVFDLFTQGERSFDRREGGLGVGLTLARRIAELHGGSIEARSRGVGFGSEFLIRLPVQSVGTQHPDSTAEIQSAASLTRVLVCDDLADSADSLALSLKLHGYQVDTCYTGEDAVRFYAESKPGVLLLDIGLPGISGYDVCERVLKMSEGSRPLLIAVTGYGQQHDRQRALAAGFDYHLVKPVDIQVLLATIRSRAPRVDRNVRTQIPN